MIIIASLLVHQILLRKCLLWKLNYNFSPTNCIQAKFLPQWVFVSNYLSNNNDTIQLYVKINESYCLHFNVRCSHSYNTSILRGTFTQRLQYRNIMFTQAAMLMSKRTRCWDSMYKNYCSATSFMSPWRACDQMVPHVKTVAIQREATSCAWWVFANSPCPHFVKTVTTQYINTLKMHGGLNRQR